MELKFKKLLPDTKAPERKSEFAPGYDLCVNESKTIPSNERYAFKTDLALLIPEGLYGQIYIRSSYALYKKLGVAGGTIDSDYRGNVKIILVNEGANAINIKKGERVAQIILQRCFLLEVKEVDELEGTIRAGGGFGLTNN